MTREQATIMFSTLVLIIAVLGGAVIALSAKYNALETEHRQVVSVHEACEAGTP